MHSPGIDSTRQAYLDALLQYVGIPSISTTGTGIGEAVEYLTARMRALGFAPRVYATESHPIVYCEAGPEQAPFTLLVYGHYDVFPVDGQAGWRTDPFRPVIDGDRIWGRGTGDNKGQHLAWLFGLASYVREHGQLPVRVKLLIEGEEETGSAAVAHFVREHRELLRADLCCYSDGPMFPDDHPVLLLGVRGILCLELTARGAARNLHSGNFGGVAPSPVDDLLRCLTCLTDRDGRFAIPGFEPDDARLRKDLPAIERLPLSWEEIQETMGVAPRTGRDPVRFYQNLMCRPNFNISGIRAGYTGDGIKTIIPNEAVAKVDIRLVGDQDPDRLFLALRDFVAAQGFSNIEVKKLVAQPPSRTDIDHPYVERVADAVTAAFGRAPMLVPSLGGTTPDYLFTRVLGIPSIVVPLAPYDENNHAANESTRVSIYLAGIEFARNLVRSLAGASSPDRRGGLPTP